MIPENIDRLRLVTVGALALFLIGCASSKPELPAVSEDGLVKVEGSKADAAYRAPDADFSVYDRVYIADVQVAFKKDWLRDQNQTRMGAANRLTQEDADRIKAAIAEEFSRIFAEELEAGGYPVFALIHCSSGVRRIA